MAHDVFISYSSKDKPIADAVCANLESAGNRCWIAPRDIAPGEDWPTAISKAISTSRMMVLIFSANSNASEDVSRELMLAVTSKLIIIPFKIENVEPEPGKQYYLARTHWLDAVNPLTHEQIQTLIMTVKSFLSAGPDAGSTGPVLPSTFKDVYPSPLHQGNNTQWGRTLAIIAAVVVLGIFTWIVSPKLLSSSKTNPDLTPTESTTPQAQVVLQDDFSDVNSGWNVSMDKVSERVYQDGEYIMRVGPRVSASGNSDHSSSYNNCFNNWSTMELAQGTDIAIDVDVHHISGPVQATYGIIFNYQDDTNFYYYQVSPGGFWALVRRTPEGFFDQTDLMTEQVILRGTAINHLRVELSDRTAFLINGEPVSLIDIPEQSGSIGFWVDNCSGSDIFEAGFDNLMVSKLP